MTITSTTAGLGAALTAALTERGLEVQPVDLARADIMLSGPLLAIRLPLRPGSGAEVTVVAVDRGQDEVAEQVIQTLAQAVAVPLDAMIDGDASMEAVAALDAVLGAFTSPVEAAVVMRAGAPVGGLLWAVDRRQAPPVGERTPSVPGLAVDHGGAVLSALGAGGPNSMSLLKDVHLNVSVELGRTEMTVAEVLELTVGAVVELDRAARSPVDIRVNGTLLAKGEVVVVDDEYAVRVTEILDPSAGLAP